ncbi:MAG TPA: hydrolase [Candidatus Limnocylindria bacterium]|nr:hydrolase [Candidatus Limnocylindria bacterium]
MKSDARTASPISVTTYRAPWWLAGGHVQTIYARQLAKAHLAQYRRERWETPDGDFIDLDWLADPPQDGEKLLVLFHGLEGCSRSHYALSLLAEARRLGWSGVVPHFRGCSGEPNRLARSYHSGDSREIDWILRKLKRENPRARVYAVGVSLGGNMLLKWLGEEGGAASSVIERAVAVSVPLDLTAAAARLDRGIHRSLYTSHFLQSLRAKVLAKITTHGLDIDVAAVLRSTTFREIDNLYTAPYHGFKNADDYWRRSSSKRWLKEIEVPTLVINATNDPFLPASALPTKVEVSDSIILDYPNSGGHVGFVSGRWPGRLDWLPARISHFFAE